MRASGSHLFEEIGRGLVHVLGIEQMTGLGMDFLDLGCGCGRMARFLISTPIRSYTGFDRHPGMIEWCQREISTRDGRFAFQHFDLRSVYVEHDQMVGTLSAAKFQFPYDTESFDSILIASVFTHMPLDEIGHYLRELRRVVRPSGKILASVLFSDSVPYVETINFFYRPVDFLERLEDAGFHHRHLESPAKYGYVNNWYVLTRMQ